MRMRFRRKLLLPVIICFIFYVSYKILEPEISGSNFKELETNELEKLNVKHHIEGKQGFRRHQHNEQPEVKKEDVIQELKKKYKVDYNHPLKESPWKLAEKWVSARELHPEYTPELVSDLSAIKQKPCGFCSLSRGTAVLSLYNDTSDGYYQYEIYQNESIFIASGAVLRSMAKRKIISADVGYKGTQLKMSIILEGGQKAVFKPKWFSRSHVIEGLYAGGDRHNGEIAAYHLGRILEFRRSPHAIGRYINLDTEIKSVAKSHLLETFYHHGNNTCFYGKCLYCKGEDTGVCADGLMLEGVVLLWLPETLTLKRHRHPWSRVYKSQQPAKWQVDEGYCNNTVLKMDMYKSGHLLLDIVDTAVMDYLIGNADRHMFETFLDYPDPDSMLLILDNGKSFGNPHHDEKSILAPLYQCCRIRESTWYRLLVVQDGILGEVLKSVLDQDPISPVLTDLHIQAIDRRLKYVLEVVQDCIQKLGTERVLLCDR